MVGFAEEVCAAAVAGEDERSFGGASFEELAQVLVGGVGVADLELDGLAEPDAIADGDGTGGSGDVWLGSLSRHVWQSGWN